jgi:hypothetical protein
MRAGGPRTQAEWLCNTLHMRAGGPRTQVEWLCNVSSVVRCEFSTLRTPHMRAGGPRTQANAENPYHYHENLDEHKISSYTTYNTHREENP